MTSKISIEPLNEFSSMGLVREILSQPQIAMVALGSQACVSTLQHSARLMGKFVNGLSPVSRLLTRGLSMREYSLGKNSKAVVELLKKAVELPGIKGIIIYCSCLDVLTGWDEADILSQVQIPEGMKVGFLYRGPLVKRRLQPRIALKQLWEKWGYKPVPIVKNVEELSYPTAAACDYKVDFKKVILEHEGEEKIIVISPGGCASCLYDIPFSKRSRIFVTRFDDLVFSRLKPEMLVEAVQECFSLETKLLLLGTATIKMVGFDLDSVCQMLKHRGYTAECISTDGFRKEK